MGGQPRQIVGVVANVQQRGGFNGFGPLDVLPAIYLPFAQFPGGGLRTIHGWFSTGVDHPRSQAGSASPNRRCDARCWRSIRNCRWRPSAASTKCAAPRWRVNGC